MSRKKSTKQFLSDNWVALVPYVMFIIIVIVMACLNTNTVKISYISNKLDNSFSLILVAVGQTIALLTGGFDLSVGGIICITNCLAASRMQDNIGSMLFWAVLCLAIGILIGCFNGYIIERTKMQPFIVTLVTQSICLGIALLIMKVDGGNVPRSYVKGVLYRFGPIPLSFILLIVLLLIWFYFKKTKTGMNIYAIGSNKKSANLNGIPVLKTMVIAYAISGGFAALAGLYRTAAVASGSPTAGSDFVMSSISAAVIGGTALTGGIGGVVGSVIGALILRYITDLLVFMKISSYWTSLVQGVILILAVALSAYGVVLKKRKEGIG